MTSGTVELNCSNSGETFSSAIAVSLTDSIVLTGTVVPSESDGFSGHDTAEISKLRSNIIPLIYNYTLPSDIQTKIMQLIFISLKCLTSTTNHILL